MGDFNFPKIKIAIYEQKIEIYDWKSTVKYFKLLFDIP